MAAKTGARVSTQKTVGQFKDGRQISASTSSAVAAADIATECVRVYTDVDVYITYGNSSTTATTTQGTYNIFQPATTTYDHDIGSNPRIAVITASGTGTVHYSEIE